jgi:hypothetical protein
LILHSACEENEQKEHEWTNHWNYAEGVDIFWSNRVWTNERTNLEKRSVKAYNSIFCWASVAPIDYEKKKSQISLHERMKIVKMRWVSKKRSEARTNNNDRSSNKKNGDQQLQNKTKQKMKWNKDQKMINTKYCLTMIYCFDFDKSDGATENPDRHSIFISQRKRK